MTSLPEPAGDRTEVGNISNSKAVAVGTNAQAQQVDLRVDTLIIQERSAYDVRSLEPPYLGLHPFTFADRASFAGRKAAIQEAMAELVTPGEQRTLLFITGASGSGKSSLACAGLLPALGEHYQKRKQTTQIAYFRPGARPMDNLGDALVQLGLPREALHDAAMAIGTPSAFLSFVRDATPEDQVNLLVIDQFEELFRLAGEAEAETLIAILSQLGSFSELRTHIVVTLRSDYLGSLFPWRPFYDLATKRGLELREMNEAELRASVLQPLHVKRGIDPAYLGKDWEPDLVAELARQASPSASYLPLLQLTVYELFRRGQLTLGAYSEMGGSLATAIRDRANTVVDYVDFDRSVPSTKRPEADTVTNFHILTDLVQVSTESTRHPDIRRSRTRAELIGDGTRGEADRERLVDELSSARLLRIERRDDVHVVDIIHESLIANWDRLRGAINAQRQLFERRSRFEQAIKLWLSNARAHTHILRDVGLAEARTLLESNDIAVSDPDARALLGESLAEAEREQHRLEQEAAQLRQLLNLAVARQLSVQAETMARLHPHLLDQSVLLAIESMRESPSADADFAIRRGLDLLALRLVTIQQSSGVRRFVLSRPRGLFLAANDDRTIEVSEAGSGALVGRWTHDSTVAAIAIDDELQELLTVCVNGSAQIAPLSGDHPARKTAVTQDPSSLQLGHSGLIELSPTGHAAWAVHHGRVGLLNLRSGDTTILVTAQAPDGHVGQLAFSPEGKYLAAATAPPHRLKTDALSRSGVQVWEVVSCQESGRCTTSQSILDLVFSPDEELLWLDPGFGAAPVLSARSLHEVARVEGRAPVAFSPSGQLLITSTRRSHRSSAEYLLVWEIRTGKLVAQVEFDQPVNDVAFSPKGDIVAAATGRSAQVRELMTGRELARIPHTSQLTCVAFDASGGRLVTLVDGGALQVWQLPDTLRRKFEVPRTGRWVWLPESLAISPDGRYLAAACNHLLALWETISHRVVGSFFYEGSLDSIVWSSDGTYLATITGVTHAIAGSGSTKTGTDGIVVLRVPDLSLLTQITSTDSLQSIRLCPARSLLVAGAGGEVRIWDALNGEELQLDGTTDIRAAAFSESGEHLVTWTGAGLLQVWDVATRVVIAQTAEKTTVKAIAVTSHRRLVSVADGTDSVHVWDWRTGSFSATGHLRHEASINVVEFVSDGEYVLTADGGRSVYCWESGSRRRIAQLLHAGEVTAIVTEPGGASIAALEEDKLIRVWDVPSGKERCRIPGDNRITAMAFSPSRAELVVATADFDVVVHSLDATSLIEEACTRLTRNLSREEWQHYVGPDDEYRATCAGLAGDG